MAIYGESARRPTALTESPTPTPTGLTVTADSDTEITLDWTNASDFRVRTYIERSLNPDEETGWAQITVTDLNAITYTDEELEPETEYFYRIRSYTPVTGFSAYSDTESATTDPAP